MNFYNLSHLSIAVAIALSACGGGGGGGSSVDLAKLDFETIDKLGISAALATPGCDYTSDSAATPLYNEDMAASYRVLIDTIKQREPLIRTAQRASYYAGTTAGECGGTLVIAGEHDDGNDDLTYTYDDYCVNNTAGSRTILNGVTNVFFDGHGTTSGPVVDVTKVSTTSNGVVAESLVESETSTKTFHLSKFEYTGDDISDTDISADEVKVVSDDATYRATNIRVVTDSSGGESVKVNSATYHDPENGAVKISTTMVPVSMGSTGAASITVTGADGSSATFTTDDISNGVFVARDGEGAIVGALDCSGLTAGINNASR